MAKIILRQEAIDDISDIWEYTSRTWTEDQADKYYGMIKSACRQIANNSVLGIKYDRISSNVNGPRVGKHIVFYHRISNNEIEVIRILHERMDLKNILSE